MSGSRSWQAGRRPDGRQAEWSRRTGRRSLHESRRSRTVKLAAALCGLLLLIGLGVYLATRYQPVSRPALAAVGDPLYRDLALPPNAGAESGNHIDLVRLHDDVGDLFAPAGEPSSQDWNLLTADRLLVESRDRLAEICRDLPSDERTIVIYCGLLGLSRDGKAVFLVSDERGTDRQIPATEWIMSLSAAAETVDAQVLMLIDPGPAMISWSEGILASDFAAQLKSELADKSLKNICLILASGPGETSWRVTDLPAPAPKGDHKDDEVSSSASDLSEPRELGRSVFSYYVVSGLRGDGVDRSGRAKGTADDGPQGNRDGRITANELFAFVADKVDRWAISHRGVPQTVMKIGGRGDFLVGAVAERPLSTKKDAPKDKEPASSDPSTGKASAAAGESRPKVPKEDAATAAERRLAQLWTERDRLSASPLTGYAASPDEWRELQSKLLAAELRLRIGLVDAAVKLLDDSERQIAALSTEIEQRNFEKQFGGAWYRPFLPTVPVASKPAAAADPEKPPGEAAATPPPPDLAGQLEAAVKLPPTMPIPNEQAIRDRLADRAGLSIALDWAVSKGTEARRSEDWTALGRIASLIPAADMSLELRAIRRIADASKAWTGSDADRKASLAARLLRVTKRFGGLGLDDPAALAMCRQSLTEGLLATAAAERWLVIAGDVEEAERQLGRAESALQRLEESTSAVSNARHLQDRLRFQLPSLAAWAATVREREPKRNADGDRYDRLRSLSADLDVLGTEAASLEVDWGTLRSRIAAAWSTARIDDERGTGSDLSTLILGERRVAALLRGLSESGGAAADRGTLDARLRATVAAIEALPLDVATAIADRSREPTWADIDGQLRFADLPGLTADRRQRLRQALQSLQHSGPVHRDVDEPPRWEAGTWHGFWSRQVLDGDISGLPHESSSERTTRFAQVWQAFLDSLAAGEPESMPALRADLAAAIRGLVEADRRSSKVARAAATEQDVSLLLGLYADFDAISGGESVLRQAWSALPIQNRPAGTPAEGLVFRSVGAELSDDDSVIAASGSRSATLSVHSFPERGHLVIKSGAASNPIDVFLGEQRVPGGKLPDDAKDPKPTVQFRSDLTGDESVIVALVDRDQFPISIQHVRVVPEVGEERWRIRFAIATIPSDVLPDAPEVLSLPPRTAEPLALVPLLEFPAAAPTQNATVEVQQRESATSSDWRTVLGPKTFALGDDAGAVTSGDLRRIVLDFTPAPPAQPQPQTDAPAATKGPAAAFSFENGLRFLVRLDGKELPPREIWPVTFDASRFISEDAQALDVSLQGAPPRIEALVTATTTADPRIPKSVPIELDFDSRLDPLVGEQKATKGFVAPGTGGTLRLFGQIGDAQAFDQLLSSAGGVVALNVAGLPRAYRWRLRRGQEPDRIQPTDSPLELEFVKQAAGPSGAAAIAAASPPAPSASIASISLDPRLGAALIDPKDLDSVSLRYFVHQLDDRAQVGGVEPRPWTVIARRSEPGRPETSQVFFTDQIVRRCSTRMSATVTGATWSVSVESEPHEIPLNFSAAGRFEITAALRAPGAEETDAASSTIRLVIDGKAPDGPEFVSPTPKEDFSVKGALPIVCTTSDEQSGIRSLELRVDSNGNGKYEPETDARKLYDESQLASGSVSDPWYRGGDVKVRWDVPVALLPASPGAGKPDFVTIWAVAENRLGATSEAKPRRIELKREKPKPPPPPPTTGEIIVTVIPKPRPPVDPEIVLVGPDGGTDERSGKSARFNKLKPGKYEIQVTQGTTGFKGHGEAKVTVEAGKTEKITIKIE